MTVTWNALGDNASFTFGPFARCDRAVGGG